MALPEVFVPFNFPVGQAPMATFVRSTLLVSAIQTLRSQRYFDAYFKKLTPTAQQDITALIAGTWVPIGLAVEHYRAVDSLKLDATAIEGIGREVSDRINRSVLATIIRASREIGTTPWTILGQVHRFRAATWNGTDFCIYRMGPKEARVEWTAQPLASIPYFVTSFGGYVQALVGLFCTRAYAKCQNPDSQSRNTRILYRVSWA